jgi:hypothetical protein
MNEVAFLESGEEETRSGGDIAIQDNLPSDGIIVHLGNFELKRRSGWRWKRQAWNTSTWPAGRKVRAL